LAGLLVLAGCGESGPPRYDLSGSVLYGGAPIPAGSVLIAPDAAQGNSGPAISVKIQNGKYDTKEQGVGHVGGPHVLTVSGMDGGVRLFPPYEIKADLPKQEGVQDLEVPADWKNPPPQPEMPSP
jgi:hypothetical protein